MASNKSPVNLSDRDLLGLNVQWDGSLAMEHIAAHCSWADSQLENDPHLSIHLPPDVRAQILQSSGSGYLEQVALAARHTLCTDRLFLLYRPIFVDLVSRWSAASYSTVDEHLTTLSCLARILPFAPELKQAATNLAQQLDFKSLLQDTTLFESSNGDQMLEIILTFFRLLSFDRNSFDQIIDQKFLLSLFCHESLAVRYLAIITFCQVMHFADAYETELINLHVGKTLILGTWEGKDIDFRLLRLWEERRCKDLAHELAGSALKRDCQRVGRHQQMTESDLSPHTALVGNSLVLVNQPLAKPKATFVITPTAQSNLNALGTALLDQHPILLRGPAGSGKTSLVLEAARLLGKLETLITLHLNEQTDAKSLIGLYTSSTTDSGFVWHPGVVTKALSEGRWILIEDIERSPAEVLSVLRPLIESQTLFIPNRKQTIRAKEGFRILATTQSVSPTNGSSSAGKFESWVSNKRLWTTVNCLPFKTEEYSLLISKLFSGLELFIETILDAHSRINALFTGDGYSQAHQGRRPTLRDLLKWARRIDNRLQAHRIQTPSSTLPEEFRVDMFKDALDCYASHLTDEALHYRVAESVASVLNISPQQMQHHLQPSLLEPRDQKDSVRFGRTYLPKITTRSPPRSSGMPFAKTSVAMRTLESLAAGVASSEPQLLVGETGIGKTSVVQHLADAVGQKLVVVNLSQQSEASDLLGGLKPMTVRSLVLPVAERFNELFETTFPSGNEKFKIALSKALAKQSWTRLLKLWQEAIQSVNQHLAKSIESKTAKTIEPATKKRKLGGEQYAVLQERWTALSTSIDQVRSRIANQKGTQIFAFVEGRLVEAVRTGTWLLLDEINLATSDTLDHIGSLLRQGTQSNPFLLLAEADKVEMIEAHPNFRVFAAMNPATDTGKKDLVPNIRSRFTELNVHAGDTEIKDLVKIIQAYLGNILASDNKAAVHLAKAYLGVQEANKSRQLTDGAGELPHFSLRSLVRCLLYVRQHHVSHGLRRSMYEGFAMSFFTVLSRSSESIVAAIVTKELLAGVANPASFLTRQPKIPTDGVELVAFKHHIIPKGPITPDFQPHYIRTPSVDRNLLNLARATSTGRFPVLLQGPTSAGKTSMVEYLAKLCGHKFVRINNHEHTDLQEYLGNYASGSDGSLQFREGVLVDALRQGHWLVLDELNLASSDVLEALNRLLDDNRELLIPETQEIVHPHPNFMLFATQNPAGLYGGRKHLSRAFRNRFLEIHFDDIPEDELGTILTQRSQIAPSFCKQIVAVYKKLSLQRQSTRLFEQRNSFATLRDLFRWASRKIDDRQQLAVHGFLLLGERVRDPGERLIVKEAIEETIRVKIDESDLYSITRIPEQARTFPGIIWTPAMRRLFVLVSEAIKNEEPVLLVGETGCGKTQICQVLAHAFGRPLNIYNAHTNTETGDLIGSQRPVRSRERLARELFDSLQATDDSFKDAPPTSTDSIEDLIARFQSMDPSKLNPDAVARVNSGISAYRSMFLWNDGSLVRAMKAGEHFLLDEISLADDSVLERLNSVLEPSRTILLAEKGSLENVVTAKPDFQFLATMNPGGDYGKRELSAALRNRMTEIWVPPLARSDDILPIMKAKLGEQLEHLAPSMLDFAQWFVANFRNNSSADNVHLRDLLGWCAFILSSPNLEPELAFVHGASLVYIDSLGANPAALAANLVSDLENGRLKCVQQLQNYVKIPVEEIYMEIPPLNLTDRSVSLGPFSQTRTSATTQPGETLVFDPRTTRKNILRVMRALQMNRPILLEGSPGVGKTAIVTALASLIGKPLSRINLSDQTDIADLFGADAPQENESLGSFSWQDGPLLKAMQEGSWVLLDEMNLASQSVLEGLNSCIDHRKQVYIAELDRTFDCHPDFRLFAAQNPHHQGGGRKGLPLSFVNRFTVVYADAFTKEDILSICRVKHPDIDSKALSSIVGIASQAHTVLSKDAVYANGGPWEVNIRDITRWLELCQVYPKISLLYHCGTVILQRFRDSRQRARIWDLVQAVCPQLPPESLYPRLSPQSLQVGLSFLPRNQIMQPINSLDGIPVNLLPHAKSVITAFSQSWPVILVGCSGSGKTKLIHNLAAAAGARLVEISMNSDIDTIDLLGGFEQYDDEREIQKLKEDIISALHHQLGLKLLQTGDNDITQLIDLYDTCSSATTNLESLRQSLYRATGSFEKAEYFLNCANSILQSRQASGAKFVWNDGVLIDAIVKGAWVVLDNANLCNAAVLDRLNSLLEPNGHLVISEQHGAGRASVSIKPHRNFRIVLTMDPKYGELSRAMRNRSLEVFLEQPVVQDEISSTMYPWTSSIFSLRDVFDQSPDLGISHLFVDNLTLDQVDVMRDQPKSTLSLVENRDAVETSTIAQISGGILSHIYGPEKDMAAHNPQFPLLNEPCVLRYIGYDEISLITRLCAAWDVMSDLMMLRSNLKNAEEAAGSGRALTRLDRAAEQSMTRRRGNKDPKELDLAIWNFLSAMVRNAVDFVGSCMQSDSTLESLDGIDRIARYLQEFVKLVNSEQFDEAHFQALLQIGGDLCKTMRDDGHSFYQSFSDALRLFQVQRLQYGQGSQMMWRAWKPETAPDMDQLARILSLESLISQFEKLSLFLPHKRSTLFAVKSNLLEASTTRLRDLTASDIADISNSIEHLRASSEKRREIKTYFQSILDTILRKEILLRPSKGRLSQHILETFGSFEILSGIHGTSGTASDALQRLSIFSKGNVTESRGLTEQILSQVSIMQNQPLRALDRLIESGSALGTVLSGQASLITSDIVHAVREYCQKLLSTIFESHRDVLQKEGFDMERDFKWLLTITKPPITERKFQYFMSLAYDHLRPATTLLTEDAKSDKKSQLCLVGAALVHVSLAGLRLVVTDRPFDPALYPQMIRQQYESEKKELTNKIGLQREFNLRLMGQDSSLIQCLYETRLSGLGSGPGIILVARPEVSELNKVQDEFTLIIRNVLDIAPAVVLSRQEKKISMSPDFLQEWPRLRQNVDLVESRLGQLNRAYDDIVVPVRQLLQCYKLGAELMTIGSEDNQTRKLDQLSAHTVCLGATPDNILTWNPGNLSSQSLKLGWLKHFAIQARLEGQGLQNDKRSNHGSFITIVDSLYHCWKEQLAQQQVKAEAESRYYTYRDNEQDGGEAADVAEMFPVYNEDDDVPQVSNDSSNVQDLCVQLCDLHEELFKNGMSGQEMQLHILETLRSLVGSTDSIEDVLPAILLKIREENKALTRNENNPTLNIYTNASIPEIRKLVALVQNVLDRFNQISERFPEHAVPHEVMAFSEEVLDFPINCPLAKMLTKAEKLLEIMTQWQSVASSEWSVANLMEQLTSLIISWRRMELSSWSKLLLLEKHKSDDHAKTWFFIAYEACIYNSRQVIEAGDVKSYCEGLAKTLEEFLRFTTLGQFSPRLELLRRLNKSLVVLEREDPRLGPVVSCVKNVITHFSRYDVHIQDTLRSGQAELEKSILEQIKLASWKDTNTTALRESARRSHFKLFKIVKKYRALLEQPIGNFKSPELDMSFQSIVPSLESGVLQTLGEAVVSAARVCETGIPNWSSRPARLRDPMNAAISMYHVYSGGNNQSLDAAREISSMRTELAVFMKELRNETPSTATEDNAGTIKHLRERKKKLLSDTIKSVAHMGVRRNLAVSELEQQSSIAVVLAAAPNMNQKSNFDPADAAFHELLDSMPQVRAALGDHSADLTDGEVRRAVGLLEGLLSIILNQRRRLSASSIALNELASTVQLLKSTSIFSSDILVGKSTPSFTTLVQYLPWLAVVLDVSYDVLHFQQEQGDGLDLSSLLELLQNAATMCREEQARIESMMSQYRLPEGLFSKPILEWQSDTWTKFQRLGNALQAWSIKEPNVEYLLKQVIPWTSPPNAIIEKRQTVVEGHLPFSDLDEHVRKAANSIFVALQELSQIKAKTSVSTEDAGWLIQNDRFLQDSVNSLHVQTVSGFLRDALGRLAHLKGEELQLSLSLLTMAAPLFEQFRRICQDLLEKQASSHTETCRLACFLAKTFATVSTEGYCSPVDPNDGQEQSGNLESGTGLGDGEGAEDISKDVGADEDLSEFAQGGEKPEDDGGEISDAEDAVDMGAEDLDGKMDEEGKNAESQDEDEDGEKSGNDDDMDDMDEEAGDVDDLDPAAVDEKMWDEAAKQSEEKEKELKSDKQKGTKGEDQTERQDGEADSGDEGDMDEGNEDNEQEEGADDELGEEKAEALNLDSHVEDEKALELPEEMQLDGEEKPEEDLSDDGMDDLSDVDEPANAPEEVGDGDEELPDEVKGDQGTDEEKAPDAEQQIQDGEDEEMEDDQDKAPNESLNAERDENGPPESEESQVRGETGNADHMQMQPEENPQQEAEGHNEVMQMENEETVQGGKAANEHDKGHSGKGTAERNIGRDEDDGQSQNPQDQALRRLADVLERWHERREILDPSKDRQDGEGNELDGDDMADADFEHVNGEDEGDAQALGAASNEQAQNLDPSKAIQSKDAEVEEDVPMPDVPDEEERLPETSQLDRMTRLEAALNEENLADAGTSFVPERNRSQATFLNGATKDEEDLVNVDDSETVALDQVIDEAAMKSPQMSSASAAELWSYCSQLVRSFSLVLTEQLRLILSPTTATKLRGDFRTGKRLNIKRIIPYIASGYKRDKIWMRRSIPSKRNYQVLLAVDDSKSMSESGVDLLALQTTALLCTSLSMLEVGDISVIGFGEAPQVTVAHEFGQPWTSESGVQVFQRFGFNQQGTNVKSMVAQSLDMLREARMKSTASNASELWQLQLIISDGHCSDHDAIRRLVRQAKSERVVMVFAIVDSSAAASAAATTATTATTAGQSILDLKEAVFEPDLREGREGEMRVVTRQYMESFPFEYYIIVRNVRDLPGVLSQCLRGWMESVVTS